MSKSPRDNKGPLVKTGPTRDKNRSRNKDGKWRAKRSDAGKPRDRGSRSSDKKGCFLTTAACTYRGLTDDCRELETLRRFRDEVLLESPDGRALVEDYYAVAPRLVPLLDDPFVAGQVWTAIQESVYLVEAGDPQAAMVRYKRMVEGLLDVERRRGSIHGKPQV